MPPGVGGLYPAIPVPFRGLAPAVSGLLRPRINRLPPSPPGKGEIFVIFARGFAPCIPALRREVCWLTGSSRCLWGSLPPGVPGVALLPVSGRGACTRRSRLDLPSQESFVPIPPTPFPSGAGGDFCYLCKGLRPLHPCGRARAALTFRAVAAFPNSRREWYCIPGGFRHRKPPGTPCRLRHRRGVARGEAPCIRKPENSPFPAGEGGRGDGGRRFMRGRDKPETQGADTPFRLTHFFLRHNHTKFTF